MPHREERSYIFSTKNADYVNADKNKFYVRMNQPIVIPDNASEVDISLHSAYIWNSAPNITTGKNKITYVVSSTTYTHTFPEGLYSLIDINNTLKSFFIQDGLPQNTFVLSGNDISQKVSITFNVADIIIFFGAADSISQLLGFNARPSPPPSIPPLNYVDTGDTVAKFYNVNAFVLTSETLVRDGISLNGINYNILGYIPITSGPYELINYSADNLILNCCNHLIGKRISELSFSIYNEDLIPVRLIEDSQFTILIRITY